MSLLRAMRHGSASAMNALVLGVNGVLLTSQKARAVLKKKSIEFVAEKTGESARDSKILEAYAADMHGNAALGVKAFRPDLRISVREYSKFVYSPAAIAEALDAAESDPVFARDRAAAKCVLEEAADAGCPVFLFTSATVDYTDALLDALGVPHLVDSANVFASDTVTNPHVLVKPTVASVVATDYAIRARCGSDANVLFVDGNLGVSMAANRSGCRWSSMYFEPEKNVLIDSVKFYFKR